MPILGIETATLMGGVALMDETRLIAEYRLGVEVRHSERLIPAIDQILGQSGKTLSDLSAVAVSSGPGSYTGLRVGLATAKGLAMGAGLPLIQIPTLEAMAAPFCHAAQPIVPILDARRGQVYWALFESRTGESGTGDLTRLHPDTLSTLPEAMATLSHILGQNRPILFTGDLQYRAEISAAFPALFPTRSAVFPSAACVAERGLLRLKRGESSVPDTAVPIYLKAMRWSRPTAG